MRSRTNTSEYGYDNRLDESGCWVRSWSELTSAGSVSKYTRLAGLWRAMNERCKPFGFVQKRCPTYENVSCEFASFQAFAEWAVIQPGFDLQDYRGERYALDKDILSTSNKRYSPDTCAFVPQRLNSILTLRALRDTSVPYGVIWEAERGRYVAAISVNGRRKFLGRFDSPQQAHAAWQKRKAEEFIAAVAWYEQQPGFNPAVGRAILARAAVIEADMHAGRATTCV